MNLNRRRVVIEIAPAAPPCFSTPAMWLEFLATSAEYQRHGKNGPLDLRGAEPAFNWRFDFCAPCQGRYALAMQTLGKCNPDYLRNLAPAQQPAEASK